MIAVIADTHMPKGKRRLPPECVEAIRGAEALIHVGDFTAGEVLADLRALCPVVHAVHGNVDDLGLREKLQETLEVELGRSRIGLVHDAGPAKRRLARLQERFPRADAVVFGHSHLPLIEEMDGFQIFNPGSPTERRRSPRPSMGTLDWRGETPVFSHLWL